MFVKMKKFNSPQSVMIFYSPSIEGAEELAMDMYQLCVENNLRCEIKPLSDSISEMSDDLLKQLSNSDLLICVGGDGSVLHASAYASSMQIPILGVRMGRLGFLSELTSQEALTGLKQVINGLSRLESRSIVKAQLDGESEIFALNDVVIGRSTLGRTVAVGVIIDGVLVAEYRADAVILSTATGSTGYSLSGGGPILFPTSKEMIVMPVAPHLTRSNALVIPPTSDVDFYVERGYEAVLAVDGLYEYPLKSGSKVKVSSANRYVDFVRLGDGSQFYSNLADRLGWLRTDHVRHDLTESS